MDFKDRSRGAILGLAIGDALGAAVESKPPRSFHEVAGYRGGGPHGLNAREWTDDTSMGWRLPIASARSAGTWTIRFRPRPDRADPGTPDRVKTENPIPTRRLTKATHDGRET